VSGFGLRVPGLGFRGVRGRNAVALSTFFVAICFSTGATSSDLLLAQMQHLPILNTKGIPFVFSS
jgi:hypothetical protein